MFIVRALSVGSILLGIAGGAQASVLYNNLGAPMANTFFQPVPEQPSGATFFAGSSGDVSDVRLLLAGDPSNTGGAIEVTIWSDGGSGPGDIQGPDQQIQDVGGISDSMMNSGGGFSVFDLPTSVTGLTPGNPYWVLVSDNSTQDAIANGAYGGTSIVWSAAADETGVGVTGGAYYTQSFQYANSDPSFGPAQMCVVSGAGNVPAERGLVDPCSVPEPASIGVLGLGLAGLGLLRFRRRIG